ncbi:MAG: RDD family protein [Acidimicrobiia bacterium]|nr:RDD family protein [Acidimicrobiia bacterium]
MQTVERYDAATPEDVVISVSLAGVGSRAAAAVIDTLLQIVIIVVAEMVLTFVAAFAATGSPDLAAVMIALNLVVVFVVLFGYHVVFEYFWRGVTPGKSALRIHVARDGGLPLTLAAVLIRNILRLVDFLPAFYALGLVVLCSNGRRKRIGDFMAGTVVVKNDISEPGTGYIVVAPRPHESYAWWDTSGVTDEEELLVRRFLDRRHTLRLAARVALGEDLAQRLRPKVLGPDAAIPAEWFLENVALATSDRHSRATWAFLQAQEAARGTPTVPVAVSTPLSGR